MDVYIPFPEIVPVMVIRKATLFPKTLFPLHIFEPRFRKMLEYALENDRMFALAMPDDSDEEIIRPVATIGLIRASVTNPDGTSNLILHGICRACFDSWIQLSPFRIAKVLPFGDVIHESDSARSERRAQLLQVLEDCGLQFPQSTASQIDTVSDPDTIVDLAAANFLKSAGQRQTILEEEHPILRQHRLIEFLVSNR